MSRRYQKIPKRSVCFVSALYKGENFTEHDNPPQFPRMDGFDYLLFTNVAKDKLKTSWTIINKNFDEYEDSVIKSRVPKFQAHTLPELQKYDYLIYMDAYFYPRPQKNRWIKTIEYMETNNVSLMQEKNPYRDCAYEECDEIVRLKKDSLERAENTKKFFEQEGLVRKSGLWRNTFLIYKNNDPSVCDLMNEFWKIYSKNDLMHRDQPLYMLALKRTGFVPHEFKVEKMFIRDDKAIGKHVYVK